MSHLRNLTLKIWRQAGPRDPGKFAALMQRISAHRADKEAAELRWLEVAELAEALQR